MMQTEENLKLSFGFKKKKKHWTFCTPIMNVPPNYGSYTNQILEREYLFVISKTL